MADVALAGKRHAQCAVDEEFESGVGRQRIAHGADLRQRQLARRHHLGKTGIGQEARLFRCADVALGAGVELERWQVEFQQAHVLHDQRIDAGLVQLPDQLARRFQLGIVQDGVQGDENAGVVAVSEFGQTGDLAHRVTGVVARAERRAADVNRVRAVQDRLAADVGGPGGREQFKLVGGQAHDVVVRGR